MPKVGKPAPEFTTMSYQNGDFEEVSLSDYEGQWKIVFFYPGDFTFV
ncbi:AhpC/TSA family protein [Halarsenatibacter silvermanii]|uniref:AhpC/TSA family protein n=3 Tax=Halarsenatibacter silvermanii TaxID=321763 RepID=A0A1G9KJ89_9FIRM|nr:AhpC/TSA family protein [Halarsenatibacter silvermanii]